MADATKEGVPPPAEQAGLKKMPEYGPAKSWAVSDEVIYVANEAGLESQEFSLLAEAILKLVRARRANGKPSYNK